MNDTLNDERPTIEMLLRQFSDAWQEMFGEDTEEFITAFDLRITCTTVLQLSDKIRQLICRKRLSGKDEIMAQLLQSTLQTYQGTTTSVLYMERISISGKNNREVASLLHSLASRLRLGKAEQVDQYFARHPNLFDAGSIEQLYELVSELIQSDKASDQDRKITALIHAYIVPLMGINNFWQQYDGSDEITINPKAFKGRWDKILKILYVSPAVVALGAVIGHLIGEGRFQVFIALAGLSVLPLAAAMLISATKNKTFYQAVNKLEKRYGISHHDAETRRAFLKKLISTPHIPANDRVLAQYLLESEKVVLLRLPYARRRSV